MPLPRVAVIGTGWGTRVQIPAFRGAGFTVTAIWGRTREKAEKAAQEYNIPFFSNKINEILLHKEVELVCIATPPNLHAEIAVMAINAGKHVICEKPTALMLSQAQDMLDAAKYYPQLLSIVDHELRFLPTMNRMRELIRDGYCGRVIVLKSEVLMGSLIRGEYNWWCDESLGGGALGALGAHIIDALSFLTGLRALEVHGVQRTYIKETKRINGFRHISSDDYCAFQLKFDHEIHATINLNTHIPGKYEQEIAVVGDRGRLILKGADLWGYRYGMTQEELVLKGPEVSKHSPFVRGTEVMFRCLREAYEKDDLFLMSDAATFEDGFYTQAVMDGVRESSKTGEWITIAKPKS